MSRCSDRQVPEKVRFCAVLNCMEDPTSGSIVFKGVDIADMKVDINVHRRHMGMVFQHFNLFNNKTVLQNVMMAPAYLQCKDLKKAKNKNRMIRFKNIFRSKKEELIPITTTKEQIKSETKKQALELLGELDLKTSGRLPVYIVGRSEAKSCDHSFLYESGCDPV